MADFIAWPDVVPFRTKKGTPDFATLFGGAHGASTNATGAILLFFLTLLVTDMTDSFGTFSGLATKLGILTPEGDFPGSGRANRGRC